LTGNAQKGGGSPDGGILIGAGRLTSMRADQQIARQPGESNRHGSELRHRAYRTINN
jgi:hypothetical protein